MGLPKYLSAILVALSLGGCVTASMQGYADRDLPSNPVTHIAAFVNAPLPLSEAIQIGVAGEAEKRHLAIEDARSIFPPTRQYSDADIKRDLKAKGVDAVLVIDVSDSGIMREYAGTIFRSSFSGMGTVNTYGNISTLSYGGSSSGFATPIINRSRQTSYQARLTDPSTGRNLWVGQGQISAAGTLFVGDTTSASQVAAGVFSDLQAKGLITPL